MQEQIYRRFELINPKFEQGFLDLCNTKNITRDDLLLILQTIKINPDIHPQLTEDVGGVHP